MNSLRKGMGWCCPVIFAGLAGWLYWPGDPAIATIEKAGGTVQTLTAPELRGRIAIALPDSVGDEDLERMTALDKLQPAWLQLRGSQISGRGLESLKRLVCLRGLTLNSTSISDDDLAGLKAFPELATLNLEGSRISARGLEHLKGLTSLRCVSLWFTTLTADAVLQFQTARPDVIVYSEFTEKNDD
jgi:hypothetical protein